MTHEIYFKCVIACLIGNICHILVKMRSTAVDYKKANMPFSIKQYIIDDKWALTVDFATSFALVYLADEIQSEFILERIKMFFLFVGFTGSYVVMTLMSVSKRKFRAVIDEKSNIADSVTGTEDLNKSAN